MICCDNFFLKGNEFLAVVDRHSGILSQALLAYANTPCKTLGKSPAQMAYGRRLKDFLPRSEESLRPVPKDLMDADEKELRQLEIRRKSGERWDEHTKSLPKLKVGDLFNFRIWLDTTP